MPDPKDFFERWYEAPLKKLEELPNGDGGFVVLATACFLYERYVVACIKERGDTATPDAKIDALSKDFNIDDKTANVFWDVIRNGFLHQAMPKMKDKGGETVKGWQTSSAFDTPITFDKKNNILKVEPWKFRDRVLHLWKDNIELISKNESFPWARIWEE